MTAPDKIWLGCMTEDFQGATMTMDGWSAYPELKEGTWLEGPHEYRLTSAHPVTVGMLENLYAISLTVIGAEMQDREAMTIVRATLYVAIAAMKEMK